jgi:hypothetical protein
MDLTSLENKNQPDHVKPGIIDFLLIFVEIAVQKAS